MDLENVGNFKYYKCRSLLACDSGGTVYDTSKRYENLYCNTNLVSYTCKNQNESRQLENLVYVVNREKEYKQEEVLQVDSTTHLDDDEFNDYELYSNISYEPENEVVKYVPAENRYQHVDPEKREYSGNGDFDYRLFDSEEFQQVYDLVEQMLNSNNSANTQYCEYSQLTDNLNKVKLNEDFGNEKRNNISQRQEGNITNKEFFISFKNKPDLVHLNHSNNQLINKYDYDLTMKTEIESSQRHAHKRKQIYTVKDDSFTELLDDNKDMLNEMVDPYNSKIKRKKPVYNKENQVKKMQYQKKNPFANLKMNSILKGNKQFSKKVKNHYKQQTREAQATVPLNNENYQLNNFSNEIMTHKRIYQIDYHSTYNSRDDVLQEINTAIKLNSDLTNADYLEYVQPRERIVESDMDKLLSPIIDVEISEVVKTRKMEHVTTEKHSQVDCNGNEVDFQDIQKNNSMKSVLSTNEIVERELCLKSAYAKKLGYENYFNTSNDSVINEILYDQTLTYKKVELDIDTVKNMEIVTNNHFLNRSVKPISCTLIESLNEFNRFGDYAEDWKNNKSNYVVENANLLLVDESMSFAETGKHEKEDTYLSFVPKQQEQNNSNLISNFSEKTYFVNLNSQSRYNSSECGINADNDSKPTSLKIKIKRINDECNEYVIDDINGQNMKAGASSKNVYKYECYDCCEKFRTKKILKNHVSENHRGPYDSKCEICFMKFKKSSAHKRHQPWCQKSITHKCYYCNKVYCYQASLVKHLKTHGKFFHQSEV